METEKQITTEKSHEYICFVLRENITRDEVHLRSVFTGHGLTNLEKSEKEIINKRRQMENEICAKNE